MRVVCVKAAWPGTHTAPTGIESVFPRVSRVEMITDQHRRPRAATTKRPRASAWAALLIACVAGAACKQSVGDPLGLIPRFAPFERLPYLQAVDASSATVRWLAIASVSDSAQYRTDPRGSWRALTIERSDRRTSVTGIVATRTARIEGLEPSQSVAYRVWADTVAVGPFSFRTAPLPGDSDTIRVLAFGDSGWGSDAQIRLAEQMQDREFDLAIHMGDIAYQNGSEADFTLRHFQVYRSLLAQIPFFPSVGNHDLRSDGGMPYRRAFVWPASFEDARFYSYRWGSVKFLALDTIDEPDTDWSLEGALSLDEDGESSTDGAEIRDGGGRQYEWLVRELAAAQADSTVRWIIVYMHHPPYSHARGISGHGSDLDLQREIAPLFDRYGVDLVLSGHDHHYERSNPVHDGEVAHDGCGPVYILTGGGGASRFVRGVGRSPLQARGSREYHFVNLDITESTLRAQAWGEQGQLIDGFLVLPYEGETEDGARSPGCR